MLTLDVARKALRLTTEDFDDEIEGLIQMAQEDLKISGVKAAKVVDTSDPNITRAILTFIKANFGVNKNSEWYLRAYNTFKRHLCLYSEYREEAEA